MSALNQETNFLVRPDQTQVFDFSDRSQIELALGPTNLIVTSTNDQVFKDLVHDHPTMAEYPDRTAQVVVYDPVEVMATQGTKGYVSLWAGDHAVFGDSDQYAPNVTSITALSGTTACRQSLLVGFAEGKVMLTAMQGEIAGALYEDSDHRQDSSDWSRTRVLDLQRIFYAYRADRYLWPTRNVSEIDAVTELAGKLIGQFFAATEADDYRVKKRDNSRYRADLARRLSELSGVLLHGTEDGQLIDVNMGKTEDNPLNGALFINHEPKSFPLAVTSLIKLVRDSGIPARFEVPQFLQDAVFRPDNTIMRFNAVDDFDAFALIVEHVMRSPRRQFRTATARMTAPLKTANGTPLPGVSFGEIPLFYDDSYIAVEDEPSYLLQRSGLVAQALYQTFSGTSWLASTQMFEDRFFEIAKELGVNPERPAFNIGSSATHLLGIKRHLA